MPAHDDVCSLELTLVTVLLSEQAGDGAGSAEPHAVCGVPGLPARGQRQPAAAVRGRGQPGRETHEEEELQMGLTDLTTPEIIIIIIISAALHRIVF